METVSRFLCIVQPIFPFFFVFVFALLSWIPLDFYFSMGHDCKRTYAFFGAFYGLSGPALGGFTT